MATISVPLASEQEKFIKDYIASGKAENKAQVVRRALRELQEVQLLEELVKAMKEPSLSGDLDELARKFK
jgi:putative addiction module CopG family antidote